MARAATRDDSKPAPRIPSLTRLLLGGFFVLIGFIFGTPLFPWGNLEAGIPNDALAALILPAGSPARDILIHLAPSLSALKTLAPYDVALVAIGEPFAAGLIARVPYPEDLLAISQTGLSVFPLPHRLVALGDQNFGARLRESHQPLPWWIRLRSEIARKRRDGTMLFAPGTSPWLLGSIDADVSVFRLSVPLPSRTRQTHRALESDLQETLFTVAQLLLPTVSSMRLPDSTIVQELRQEKTAFSWSIEEKRRATYTLLQNNKPVLSYTRLIESSDCVDKNASWEALISTHLPLPELKLKISLLKQAIFFCFFSGDKL